MNFNLRDRIPLRDYQLPSEAIFTRHLARLTIAGIIILSIVGVIVNEAARFLGIW